MRRPSDDPVEWFLSWFDTSGGPDSCHEWQRNFGRGGYGRTKPMKVIGRMTEQTHVIKWILANGPIPDGLMVLHRCDNPPCGNVTHLFLGTAADNSADMVSKGRQHRGFGQKSGMAKLTESQVRDILLRHEAGELQASIAQRYGISQSNVSLIVHGKAWRHLR